MATIYKKYLPESIIEYSQSKDSPTFSYNEKSGTISIFADESIWVWKNKEIRINNTLYYEDFYYNLIVLPNTKTIILPYVMPSGINTVMLYNTGLFPKRIKKGDLLGEAILVPRVESHIVQMKDMD